MTSAATTERLSFSEQQPSPSFGDRVQWTGGEEALTKVKRRLKKAQNIAKKEVLLLDISNCRLYPTESPSTLRPEDVRRLVKAKLRHSQCRNEQKSQPVEKLAFNRRHSSSSVGLDNPSVDRREAHSIPPPAPDQLPYAYSEQIAQLLAYQQEQKEDIRRLTQALTSDSHIIREGRIVPLEPSIPTSDGQPEPSIAKSHVTNSTTARKTADKELQVDARYENHTEIKCVRAPAKSKPLLSDPPVLPRRVLESSSVSNKRRTTTSNKQSIRPSGPFVRKGFVVDPASRSSGTSKTGLKVRDRDADAVNARQLAESDRRLQTVYAKLMKEKEPSLVRGQPTGKKKLRTIHHSQLKNGRMINKPLTGRIDHRTAVNKAALVQTQLQRFMCTQAQHLIEPGHIHRQIPDCPQEAKAFFSVPLSPGTPNCKLHAETTVRHGGLHLNSSVGDSPRSLQSRYREVIERKPSETISNTVGNNHQKANDVSEVEYMEAQRSVHCSHVSQAYAVAAGRWETMQGEQKAETAADKDPTKHTAMRHLLQKLKHITMEGELLLSNNLHQTSSTTPHINAPAFQLAQPEDIPAHQTPPVANVAEKERMTEVVQLALPSNMIRNIQESRQRYIKDQKAALNVHNISDENEYDSSRVIVGDVDPWAAIESVADEILEELLLSNASEVHSLADEFVERLCEEEFMPVL